MRSQKRNLQSLPHASLAATTGSTHRASSSGLAVGAEMRIVHTLRRRIGGVQVRGDGERGRKASGALRGGGTLSTWVNEDSEFLCRVVP